MDECRLIKSLQILGEPCPFQWCRCHLHYQVDRPVESKTYLRLHGCACLIQHPMTLSEIGQMQGLSRERVRQIQEKAVKHLREKVIENAELMTYVENYLGREEMG